MYLTTINVEAGLSVTVLSEMNCDERFDADRLKCFNNCVNNS